ncbi:MAG: ATP-binding cassette domain-containing protein, partial [Acidobacteriota bacterium]|nr:ATP-binding cassette domain-containing protein [Acidobacteriota bacterium]
SLSRGQAQRVAIARAVLRRAPILVLDEAMTGLDAQSEKMILATLRRLSRGHTSVWIAHRLDHILGCDRIIVLRNGKVVQQGRPRGPALRRRCDEAPVPRDGLMAMAHPVIDDPTLKGLKVALDPEQVATLLESLFGKPCTVDSIEVIKHKPGKRCALAYRVEAPGGVQRLFAKTFRTERGARIYGTMSRLAQATRGPELIVPRPLAYFPKPKLLFTEFLEGCPLGTPLYAGLGSEPAARAARALARFHATGVSFVRSWSLAQEIDNTAAWLSHLPEKASLDAEALVTALRRLQRVATRLAPGPAGPVHRTSTSSNSGTWTGPPLCSTWTTRGKATGPWTWETFSPT